jgi:hypothetical protein
MPHLSCKKDSGLTHLNVGAVTSNALVAAARTALCSGRLPFQAQAYPPPDLLAHVWSHAPSFGLQGTSMSAPLTTGHLALMRQYFR